MALFLYLVISGRLVSGKEYDRVVEENTELRRQTPEVVRALTEATLAIKDSTSISRDVLVVLEIRKRNRE